MKALRLSPMPRSRIARLYPPCVRPLLRGVALAERPRSARAGSMPHSPIPARICPVCGAGLDVRKMQITVSVRLPAPSGGEPQVESQTFGSGQRSREARGSALRRKALAPAQPSIASDESYIDKPSRERVDRRGCGKSDPAARIQIPTIGGRGSIGDVRRHAGQAFPSARPPPHEDPAWRNPACPRLASILPVHFFHKAAHGMDERGQFPPFGDRVCGVEAVLAGIGITDRRAGRPAPVHPAAGVRHRWRPTGRPGPRPRPAAWAQVHSQVLGQSALQGVVPMYSSDPHPPVARWSRPRPARPHGCGHARP